MKGSLFIDKEELVKVLKRRVKIREEDGLWLGCRREVIIYIMDRGRLVEG